MFAIRERNYLGVGAVRSADQHGGEWWTGRNWSPASDEAKLFESEEQAEAYADEAHVGRDHQIVEFDD